MIVSVVVPTIVVLLLTTKTTTTTTTTASSMWWSFVVDMMIDIDMDIYLPRIIRGPIFPIPPISSTSSTTTFISTRTRRVDDHADATTSLTNNLSVFYNIYIPPEQHNKQQQQHQETPADHHHHHHQRSLSPSAGRGLIRGRQQQYQEGLMSFGSITDSSASSTQARRSTTSPTSLLALKIIDEQLHQVGSSYAAGGAVSASSASGASGDHGQHSSGLLRVYYNTIGAHNDVLSSQDSMQRDICNKYNLSCIHMRHYNKANEDVTLTKLHMYCNEHPNHTVIYIHSKGTFHHDPTTTTTTTSLEEDSTSNKSSNSNSKFRGQDEWRRAMTAAVTSKECIESVVRGRSSSSSSSRDDAPNDANNEPVQEHCDVCGLLFQPLPGIHFPGNMFIASCQYVNLLLPFYQFHNKKYNIRHWIRVQKKQNTFQTKLFVEAQQFMGLYRYESEHYIGSHPILKPCDVSNTSSLQYWQQQQYIINQQQQQQEQEAKKQQRKEVSQPYDNNYPFHWSMAPRYPYTDTNWAYFTYANDNTTILETNTNNNNNNLNASNHNNNNNVLISRIYEYFLLRGALLRWYTYYNTIPNNDSYVWKWFPDGNIWYKAIQKYGIYKVLYNNDNDDQILQSIVNDAIKETTN